MKTTTLVIITGLYIAILPGLCDSVKTGNGKKFHAPLTNGITRCGWPVGTNAVTTNAVNCKNCLVKKAVTP